MSADDPRELVRRLAAELVAAEHRLLGRERARLVAGGRDRAGLLTSPREVATGFVATVGVLLEEAEGVARAGGSLDDYAPPGRPHIIRWVGADEATIEDADGVLVLLRATPVGDTASPPCGSRRRSRAATTARAVVPGRWKSTSAAVAGGRQAERCHCGARRARFQPGEGTG
jgi:hypothetical protein